MRRARALVGVMGHVDHGKTALVRALTGTDTDRLPEEKARGLSIALGFAHLDSGRATVSFVDMPGHERFLRTMIAGAGGLDLGLLCVAADEGVMPQTREHVSVAALMGLRRVLVAVTRADTAGADPDAASAAALAMLHASGLQVAGVVVTSARSGLGVDDLKDRLLAEARSDTAADAGWCALPVDRAFTRPGFGLVVTGTLRHGPLGVGDEIEAAAGRLRVRGLQVHGAAVDRAEAGQRVAANLRGGPVERGEMLATPDMLRPSEWFDVLVTLEAPQDLRPGMALRLLWGTREAGARLRPLETLEPGRPGLAQLRLEQPQAVPGGERFVLRLASPPRLLGGGRVLDPLARRRRKDAGTRERLRRLAEDPVAAVLDDWRSLRDVGALLALGPQPLRCRLDAADARTVAGRVASRATVEAVDRAVLAAVEGFQRRHPTRAGLPPDRLRGLLDRPPPQPVLEGRVAALVHAGLLSRAQGLLRRADLDPVGLLGDGPRRLVRAVERQVAAGGLTPPDVAAVADGVEARQQALRFLVRTGVLVRTVDRVHKREVVFHAAAVDRAGRVLRAAFADGRGFRAGEAARALGTTRKFVIPLLEHLDGRGVTRRDGDLRTVVTEVARAD